MSIKYSYSPLEPGQKLLSVKFTNDEGLEFTKSVCIPYLPDGSVNKSYFDEIIEGQLRGMEYKQSIGSIEFEPPSVKSDYVAPTE